MNIYIQCQMGQVQLSSRVITYYRYFIKIIVVIIIINSKNYN